MCSSCGSVVKNILMRGAAVFLNTPNLTPSLLTCPSIQPLGKELLEMTFLSFLMEAAKVKSSKTHVQNKCVCVCGVFGGGEMSLLC